MSSRAARSEVFELGLDPTVAHTSEQVKEAKKLVCEKDGETLSDTPHDHSDTCVVQDNKVLETIHEQVDHTAIGKGEEERETEEEKLKEKEEVIETISNETKEECKADDKPSAHEEEATLAVEETPKPKTKRHNKKHTNE